MKLPISQFPDQPKVRAALKPSRRENATKRFDEAWISYPEQFDPRLHAHTFSRYLLERDMISKHSASQAVDLGAGLGLHTRLLHEKNIPIEAVDVSPYALNQLQFIPNQNRIHAYIPYTPLPDNKYDLVLALDLIGDIPNDEQRLSISEISRLLSNEGKVLLSSELDIYSEAPLAKILYLVESELHIECIHLLYFSPFIRFCDFFSFLPSLHKRLFKWKSLARLLEKCACLYQTETDASAVVIVASKKKLTNLS